MDELEIQMYYAQQMYFELLHPLHKDAINVDMEGADYYVHYSVGYDYEQLPSDMKHFYIDVEFIIVPLAKILVRSCFKFEWNGSWEEIMHDQIIQPMVKGSLMTTLSTLNNRLAEHDKSFDDSNMELDKMAASSAEDIIQKYHQYRAPQDQVNLVVDNTMFLEFSAGTDPHVMATVSFMVIDAVLFWYDDFDRKHNQTEFEKMMPLALYFTLKIKCKDLEEEDAELSIKHSILFIQCLDMALQLLLGDHEPLLMQLLAKHGIDTELRDEFIDLGNTFISDVMQSLEASKAHFPALDVKRDWNSLIK